MPARKPGTRMLRASSLRRLGHAALDLAGADLRLHAYAGFGELGGGGADVGSHESGGQRYKARACESASPPGSSPAPSATSPPGSPTGRCCCGGPGVDGKGPFKPSRRSTQSMRRLATLPIAVRLGAAFGLLALALAAVTLTATHAFGTFRDDTQGLADRDVRAVGDRRRARPGPPGHRARDRRAPLRLRRRSRVAGRDRRPTSRRCVSRRRRTSADARRALAGTAAEQRAREFSARVDRVERAASSDARHAARAVRRSRTSRSARARATLYTGEISLRDAARCSDAVVELQDAVRSETAATAAAVAARADSTPPSCC